MTWRDCTLGDVITLKRGHDLPEKKRVVGSVPVVSSSGITGFHNEAKVAPPGVVTGRYGTIGEVFFIEESYWPLNTALYVIDFMDNDPRFVAYLLRNTLRNYKTEKAAVPGVNRNVLHTLKVRVPSANEQAVIVSILSAYDDLIENNRRRIALLEEAARLLYREWFVHFRFPGHEHLKITDGLPEGWERRTIEDITAFLGRGISPSYDDEAEYLVVNQKCVRNRMLAMAPARRQRKEFKPEKALRCLDVLINSTGTGTRWAALPSAGSNLRTPRSTRTSQLRVPIDAIDPYWFGYALLELESFFEGMGGGATNQKELGRARIADTCIISPTHALQRHFGSFTSDTAKQIQVLADQNEKLAQARDLLLPRLMNGESAV